MLLAFDVDDAISTLSLYCGCVHCEILRGLFDGVIVKMGNEMLDEWMNEGDESGILPGFFNGLLMSYGEIYRVACGINFDRFI